MSNKELLKLGAIFVVAIVLFKLLSQFNIIDPESYASTPVSTPAMVGAPVVPSDSPVSAAPAQCYPKDSLSAEDLLPKDNHSEWAKVNPVSGDLKDANFLAAGSQFGVDTVGASNRISSYDVRGVPPIAQVVVSPWLQSTVAPDLMRRRLDVC